MTRPSREVQDLHRDLEVARRRLDSVTAELSRERQELEALREDHVFRKAVIEQASEGVCVCHDIPEFPYVQFTVWNRRMREMTGYTMDQINEFGWYQSVYPDPDLQQRARDRMNRMREGDNLDFERWTITRADGEQRVLAISTSILRAGDSVHVLGLMHDCTAEEKLREVEALARRDDLTGLKNRRGFQEAGELLLSIASRQEKAIAVAYLDIDGFKAINDSLGHPAGDRLLETLGQELSSSVRSSDVVGRLGGDEFAVLCLASRLPGTKRFFEKLHARLSGAVRQRAPGAGVSMGIAIFEGSRLDLGEALRQADQLMYEAKRLGSNRVLARQIDA